MAIFYTIGVDVIQTAMMKLFFKIFAFYRFLSSVEVSHLTETGGPFEIVSITYTYISMMGRPKKVSLTEF